MPQDDAASTCTWRDQRQSLDRRGALAPLDGGGDQGATHELVLRGGTDQTIYFADRPNREVGTVETTVLIDALDASVDDPPNAALVEQTAEGAEEIVVVELIGGEVDNDTVDVTYQVALLTDYSEVELALEREPVGDVAKAREYEASSLFIDHWCYGRPTDGDDSSTSGGWVGGRGGCSSS